MSATQHQKELAAKLGVPTHGLSRKALDMKLREKILSIQFGIVQERSLKRDMPVQCIFFGNVDRTQTGKIVRILTKEEALGAGPRMHYGNGNIIEVRFGNHRRTEWIKPENLTPAQ